MLIFCDMSPCGNKYEHDNRTDMNSGHNRPGLGTAGIKSAKLCWN